MGSFSEHPGTVKQKAYGTGWKVNIMQVFAKALLEPPRTVQVRDKFCYFLDYSRFQLESVCSHLLYPLVACSSGVQKGKKCFGFCMCNQVPDSVDYNTDSLLLSQGP